MKTYEITYSSGNGIYSANLVIAESAEQATAYYTAKGREVIGCDETMSRPKPGQPVVTVPEGWTAPAAEPETETETAQGAERDDRIAETAQDIETAHSIIKAMIKDIISQSARSAWARGVRNYALMLARNLREREKDARRNGEPSTLRSREVVRAALLNGAEDWTQYSYGGCAYIYDEDIALHTCTASEYRRKRGGKLQPNPAETWLDVQARALYQASVKVLRAYDLALDAIREGARA